MFVDVVTATEGISQNYSPQEIVTQQHTDFVKDYKVEFGQYVQANEDAMVTNTMKARTQSTRERHPQPNYSINTLRELKLTITHQIGIFHFAPYRKNRPSALTTTTNEIQAELSHHE